MRLVETMNALKQGSGAPLNLVTEEKLEQIRSHPFYADAVAEVRAYAAEKAGQLIPMLPYSYFKLFDETGSRTEYQDVYSDQRDRLNNFLLTALLDGTHISDVEDAIWAICDNFSWCYPAHFGYGGTNVVETLNAPPAGDGKPVPFLRHQAQMIDLGATGTARQLAEAIALLGDKLAPAVVHRAHQNITERVLKPFMEINTPFWWETTLNNWGAVCAGNIGIAAMYMIKDDAMLAAVLKRCTDTMLCYLDGFEEDGVCAEGLGYWNYGFSHFVFYADMLKRRTAGAIDLFKDERVHTIAVFYQNAFLNENNAVCFSDCHDKSTYSYYLNHYLYGVYDDVELPAAEYAAPMGVTLRNFIWSNPDYPTGTWKDRDALYNATQWVISRATVDGVQVSFAAKGGHNNEPHNHNDVGSFLLDIGGEVLLGDLGAGLYTRQYFGPERYTILVNGSQGHPVPVIGGKTQAEGKAACAVGYTATATEEAVTASMEMAPAYALENLTSLKRELGFCKTCGSVKVRDTFTFAGAAETVAERITTKVKPALQPDGTVVIQGKKAGVKIACSVPCQWKITEEEYEEAADNLHQKAWLVDAMVTPENGEPVDLTITKL